MPEGRVLVAGGGGPRHLASAEIYDPASGTWSSTGSMTTDRLGPTATLVRTGVLVAGGYHTRSTGSLASAEIARPG